MVMVSGSNFSFFKLRVKPVQDNPESSFPESVLMQGKNKGHYNYLFYLIVSFWNKNNSIRTFTFRSFDPSCVYEYTLLNSEQNILRN